MAQTYKILSGPSDVAPPQAGEGSGPIPASGSAHCPECRYHQQQTYKHAAWCPHIDLETARLYCQNYVRMMGERQRKATAFVTHAQRWEGKFRIVCHENNQLRKRLASKAPNTEAQAFGPALKENET